ncbi:MAG: hypothetical protein Kow0010_11220 [Dehalococcoidia bacterium]
MVRKQRLWAGIFVVVALGLFAGSLRLALSGRFGEPERGTLVEFPQDAVAESGGIRLRALGTVFSATETLVRLAVGEYSRRPWVELTLRGAWHPDLVPPHVWGSDGDELTLAHVQVGYSTDPEGRVSEDVTQVAAFFESEEQLEVLTVILGDAWRVVEGPWAFTLEPVDM